MNLKIIGSHLELTPALEKYTHTKFERIMRHTDVVLHATITLSTDKIIHKAHANVHLSGKDIHTEAHEKDMYAAIDVLVDKLNRIVLKHKEKLTHHDSGNAR